MPAVHFSFVNNSIWARFSASSTLIYALTVLHHVLYPSDSFSNVDSCCGLIWMFRKIFTGKYSEVTYVKPMAKVIAKQDVGVPIQVFQPLCCCLAYRQQLNLGAIIMHYFSCGKYILYFFWIWTIPFKHHSTLIKVTAVEQPEHEVVSFSFHFYLLSLGFESCG